MCILGLCTARAQSYDAIRRNILAAIAGQDWTTIAPSVERYVAVAPPESVAPAMCEWIAAVATAPAAPADVRDWAIEYAYLIDASAATAQNSFHLAQLLFQKGDFKAAEHQLKQAVQQRSPTQSSPSKTDILLLRKAIKAAQNV